jgi:precorrin-8X/cobalt-precorrin-8 methylmutase
MIARATDQITPAGRIIERDSFAIIDDEAGPHAYSEQEWQLVRRLIHTSGDFDFNGLTRFHAGAVEAGISAVLAGAPIVADVAMIGAGLSEVRLARFGVAVHQFIADPEVFAAAQAEGTTRAVQAMREAQRQGLLDGGILGVGNAPTALMEALRLVREGPARPALIIGMPVGFVAAAESKDALAEIQDPPWIITAGRKGGSALVVAAIHALLALAESRPANP